MHTKETSSEKGGGCPYCGHKFSFREEVKPEEWRRVCSSCGAAGPSGYTKEAADRLWGTRAGYNLTAVKDAVEELKRLYAASGVSSRELDCAKAELENAKELYGDALRLIVERNAELADLQAKVEQVRKACKKGWHRPFTPVAAGYDRACDAICAIIDGPPEAKCHFCGEPVENPDPFNDRLPEKGPDGESVICHRACYEKWCNDPERAKTAQNTDCGDTAKCASCGQPLGKSPDGYYSCGNMVCPSNKNVGGSNG